MPRARLAGLALWVCVVAAAEPGPEQAAEIEYLIGYVERSPVVFVRNGRAYTGAQAAAHIRKKYEHFKARIQSAEDFIEWAASKSLISGRTYRVRVPDEEEMDSAVWLRAALQAYRRERTAREPVHSSMLSADVYPSSLFRARGGGPSGISPYLTPCGPKS